MQQGYSFWSVKTDDRLSQKVKSDYIVRYI
jgi:hypothetical protein